MVNRANGVKNRTWTRHLGPVFIALISILVTVSFYWLHLTTPTDGSRLEPGQQAWLPEGLRLTPLVDQPSGLRDGDIVVAVEGQEIRTWTSNLVSWPPSRPDWKFEQNIQLSVLRANELETLTVTLGRYPVRAFLSRQWGALLYAFVSQIVATFVYLRRPDDHAARVLFIWAWAGSHTYAWSLGLQLSDIYGGIGFWLYRLAATGLWLLYWPAILHFAFVFPKPLPFIQRRPGIVRSIYLGAYLITFTYLAIRWGIETNSLIRIASFLSAEYFVASLYLLATVGIILFSYRRQKDHAARQKVRGVVYAGTFSSIIGLIHWLLPELISSYPAINANVLGLIALPFPVALAIAIVRHQLFDVDILIRRTLIYGALTGSLAVVYFAIVVLLQQLLPAQTQLTTVISTLIIAALFSPLRRRIQSDIDRLFYRSRYNAEQTLAAFSATAREEVDLDRLSESLLAIVEQTVQPDDAALWLRTTTDPRQTIADK